MEQDFGRARLYPCRNSHSNKPAVAAEGISIPLRTRSRRTIPRGRYASRLRIGIFGGTFDPIHNGHLAIARAARRRFKLDLVYFVPCGLPPHKRPLRLSPFLHRFTMVTLAGAGEPAFIPSLLEAGPELQGRRRSYSIDTVRRLHALAPRAELYFVLGADAFLYLPKWKNVRKLVRLCRFIVAPRPGVEARDVQRVQLPGLRVHFLQGVRLNVSASEIRLRVRRGRSLRGLVPAAVEDYLRKMKLYR